MTGRIGRDAPALYVGWGFDASRVPPSAAKAIKELKEKLGPDAEMIEQVDIRMLDHREVDFVALRCDPKDKAKIEKALIEKGGVVKRFSGVQDRLWLGNLEIRIAGWQTATIA